MRRVFAAAALLFAAIHCGPANAEGYNWTGFTVEAFVSHLDATGDPTLAAPPAGPPTQQPSGFYGGGALRYDWQFANGVVVGAVADVGGGGAISDRLLDGNYIQQYSEISAIGTVRANLGLAHGPILPYVTGGWAWARSEYGEMCPSGAPFGFCRPARAGPYDNSDTNFVSGWVLGGGVRINFVDNIVLGAEFLHMDFGSDTYHLGRSSTGLKVTDKPVDLDANSFRFSVGYRFN